MGIRAIYTEGCNKEISMPCEVLGCLIYGGSESYDYSTWVIGLEKPIPRENRAHLGVTRDGLYRYRASWHQLTFPPHSTPADWQPEPCSCPLCLEDHAPDCAAQNCNNVPTPECTCGLVEE